MKEKTALSQSPARLWFLLVFGSLLYFAANFQCYVFPGSLADSIFSATRDFWLAAAFFYAYGLSQLVMGLFTDRFGGYRVVSFGAFAFCLGSLVFAFSGSYLFMLLSRILMGAGASTIFLGLVKECALATRKNFTLVVAGVAIAGYFGQVMSTAPFNRFAKFSDGLTGSLSSAFSIVAFATGTVYILFLLSKVGMRMPPVHRIPFSLRPFADILRKKHNLNLFVFYGCNFAVFFVAFTICEKLLEDVFLIPSEYAVLIRTGMLLLAIGSTFLSSFLSRLFGNRRQIFVRLSGIVMFSSCMLLFVALLLSIRSPWLIVFMFTIAVSANIQPIATSLIRETNFIYATAAAVSFLNFSSCFFVAVLLSGTGHLLDLAPVLQNSEYRIFQSASYLSVFALFFVLSFVALLRAYKLRETMGANVEDSTP